MHRIQTLAMAALALTIIGVSWLVSNGVADACRWCWKID